MGNRAKFLIAIASGDLMMRRLFSPHSAPLPPNPNFLIHFYAFDIFCDEHVLFLQEEYVN